MPALMERVEGLLAETSGSGGPDLHSPASDTLAAGGKRLRPLLVLICGGALEEQDLVRAAAAVELIHMATLVHDDVVDDALLRRGRPTVFARDGRETATATGDFLFSRAFALLAANGDPAQVRALSDACLALARGELAQRHDAYRRDVDEQRYVQRCELKTASLFAAACVLGALAAGRPAAEAAALESYGRRLGLAFQMLDDVLDVSGPAGAHGQAPRHRPARRHGHAAADPRRPRPGRTCARSRRVRRRRRCATASRRRARWRRHVRAHQRSLPKRKLRCAATSTRRSNAPSRMSPTASPSGTPEIERDRRPVRAGGRGRVIAGGSPRSLRGGCGSPPGPWKTARSLLPCWPG